MWPKRLPSFFFRGNSLSSGHVAYDWDFILEDNQRSLKLKIDHIIS